MHRFKYDDNQNRTKMFRKVGSCFKLHGAKTDLVFWSDFVGY